MYLGSCGSTRFGCYGTELVLVDIEYTVNVLVKPLYSVANLKKWGYFFHICTTLVQGCALISSCASAHTETSLTVFF